MSKLLERGQLVLCCCKKKKKKQNKNKKKKTGRKSNASAKLFHWWPKMQNLKHTTNSTVKLWNHFLSSLQWYETSPAFGTSMYNRFLLGANWLHKRLPTIKCIVKFSAVDIVARIEWECLEAFTSSVSVFKECLTNTVFELS